MSLATGIRATIRKLITNLGNAATVYSFSNATKTNNDEGEVTVSNWGSGASIKAISSNNYTIRRVFAPFGEESNSSERVVYVRDDVTVGERDKINVGSNVYVISEIKRIDPIEDLNIAFRLVLDEDARYA